MIATDPVAQERGSTLLVRTWVEPAMPEALRARLLTVAPDDEPTTWATAVGDAAITREVLRWLRSAHGGEPAPLGAVEGSGAYATPPLVDGDWVQAHLDDPDVVLVEVDDADHYPSAHLPGAVRVSWEEDLQHPVRRRFLDAAGFAALMDRHGIRRDSHVVLYGDMLNMRAAVAYWYFSYHGHARLSLLDGGRARWLDEGRPVTTAVPAREPTAGYRAGPGREDIRLSRDQLLAGLVGAPPGTFLLDCRPAPDFAGRPEHGYDAPVHRHRVTGRIPGAVNLPAEELVDPDTAALRPLADLERLCRELGMAPEDEIIVYCGVADRSALAWFVLHELLRWPDVRCYTGAWAEYGSLVDVPVERD